MRCIGGVLKIPVGNKRVTLVGKDRKDAKIDDLKEGCKVEATFTGPVMESYPVQATAKEVVILELPKDSKK